MLSDAVTANNCSRADACSGVSDIPSGHERCLECMNRADKHKGSILGPCICLDDESARADGSKILEESPGAEVLLYVLVRWCTRTNTSKIHMHPGGFCQHSFTYIVFSVRQSSRTACRSSSSFRSSTFPAPRPSRSPLRTPRFLAQLIAFNTALLRPLRAPCALPRVWQ